MRKKNESTNRRAVSIWALPVVLLLSAGAAGCGGGGEATPGDEAPTQATVVPEQAFTAYFAIQESLASDSIDGIPRNAQTLLQGWPDNRIAPGAKQLVNAEELDAARETFKGISTEVIQGLKAGKYKLAEGEAHQAYCPMAEAAWLQRDKQISNPYYGSSMLRCGEIKTVHQSKD